MSQPVDTNISKETVQPEEKSDIVERFDQIHNVFIIFDILDFIFRDLSLDKLLKLSKLFKNGVDTNLNKFKVTENKYILAIITLYNTN